MTPLQPPAPVLTIEVNSTSDGPAINPSVACDNDPGTPGEQCTLRGAIQRANAVEGDDLITFNIPPTAQNCDVRVLHSLLDG